MTALERAAHVSDLASFQALLAGLSTELTPPGDIDRGRVLASFAGLVLAAGAWLEPLTHVRSAHSELGAAALSALHFLAGGGQAHLHHSALYRAALASLGIDMPTEAAHLEQLGPAQAVGMHAAHVAHGVPALVAETLGPHGALFLARQGGSEAQALSLRMLHVLAADPRTDWRQVAQGALAHVALLERWCARQVPEPAPSPRAAMAALVAEKAAHAVGFHGRVTVGKCPLDTMFASAGSAPEPLLAALASSPWVTPGAPDASRLVEAARFGGPMFGVFTARELEVVRSWIASLPEPAVSEPKALPPSSPAAPPRSPRLGDASTEGLGRSAALYHRLLTTPHAELTQRAGRSLLDATLERARGRCTEARLARRGLWPWSPERFTAWVHDRLRKQAHDAAGAERSVVRLLSRDDALFVLLQLTPAAFVDGAWLQGLRTPRLSAHPAVGRLLGIYHDELGAGVTLQHHGNVMRHALAAQGIELPACDSRAFAAFSGFTDAAFALPAFWLALTEHAEEQMPELLGLNLAVEMAGIGGDYARMTCLLRRHGIDSYFFELHNTIDNAASGHTAISVEAIIAHLAQVGAVAGPSAVDGAWQRVLCGFESYTVASRPLAYAMLQKLGPRTALRWLGATVRGEA